MAEVGSAEDRLCQLDSYIVDALLLFRRLKKWPNFIYLKLSVHICKTVGTKKHKHARE